MGCNNWLHCTELSAGWEDDANSCSVTARAYAHLSCYPYYILCFASYQRIECLL